MKNIGSIKITFKLFALLATIRKLPDRITKAFALINLCIYGKIELTKKVKYILENYE